MRMTRIDAEALLIAEGDQRESELKALASQLGGYRARLLEAGFSQRESFRLIEHLIERAAFVSGETQWVPFFDLEEEEE